MEKLLTFTLIALLGILISPVLIAATNGFENGFFEISPASTAGAVFGAAMSIILMYFG